MYVGGGGLVVATNTNHALLFATNRYVNSTALHIGTDSTAAFLSSVSATSFHTTSDKAIKEDVTVVTPEECQAIFDAVEVKRYLRTDTQQRRVGFIAQDVQAVATGDWACLLGRTLKTLPGGEDPQPDPETLLALGYDRLTTVLWGALKSQQARLSALEQRVAQLEG